MKNTPSTSRRPLGPLNHLILLAALGGLASSAWAAPLAYEPFDYPAGQYLGFSKTTGQTNAAGQYWFNGTGDVSDASIVSGSLTYPGLAASGGNSFTNGSGVSQQSNRFFFNTGGTNGVTNGTMYASFLMRVDSLGATFTGAPANQGILTAMGYINNLGTFIQAGHLWIGTNGGDLASFRLGSAKLASGQNIVQWASGLYPVGQTLFIVQSYTFNTASSGDDVCEIWVNPDASTFGSVTPPIASATAIVTGTDIDHFELFNFRQTTAVQTPEAATFDELRIGTNWADVTPPAAALPPQIISIAGAGTTSVTVTWTNAQNGTNYVLQYSTNLSISNWSDLAPVTASGTTASQTDHPPGGSVARFYRVWQQ